MEQAYVLSHIIFETVVGSRAYGTFHEESDFDKAGVMVPGKEYFYGFDSFSQFQGFPNCDRTIYDIRKALKLISDNNPNMLDLLYSPTKCILTMTPYWERIVEHRDWFLSKKCKHTFSGYAFAQLARIETHRKFLLHPLEKRPERSDFGLPDTSIFPTSQLKAIVYSVLSDFFIPEEKENFLNDLNDLYGIYVIPLFEKYIMPEKRSLALDYLQVGIKSQANTLMALGPSYVKDEYLEEAQRELRHYHALAEWERYCEWKKHRNKARAGMEEKFGYDCKHAMHCIRLLRNCVEILRDHTLNVDRTGIDADELIAIRNGSMTYEQITEYSAKVTEEIEELYKTSTLQRAPQFDKIKDLCIEVVDSYLRSGTKVTKIRED